MSGNEFYPPHRIFFEYHGGNENLRIQKLNKKRQSLKLLIIDDDEHIKANLRYFLNDKGYDVTSASDGSEGLKLIENERQGFDLIITDIVMPQISGISLISIVKKKFPDIPVIVITGWGNILKRSPQNPKRKKYCQNHLNFLNLTKQSMN